VTRSTNWVPEGANPDQPSVARIYDYLLGGGHNFAVDRAAGDEFMKVLPEVRDAARINRAFLRRAVMFLASQGIDQFLDIGSGIPTVGNVHEIAQQANPDARVVYVDNDPIAVTHSQLMLRGNERAVAIQADLREPSSILRHPKVLRLLDLSRPVGLLMVAVYHFVDPEESSEEILVSYRDALARGSWLVLTMLATDVSPDTMAAIVDVAKRAATPLYPRTVGQIKELFGGWDLTEPGLVPTPLWRPENPDELDEDIERFEVFAGVARKP
jgi:S-adenosyl methyltransferase